MGRKFSSQWDRELYNAKRRIREAQKKGINVDYSLLDDITTGDIQQLKSKTYREQLKELEYIEYDIETDISKPRSRATLTQMLKDELPHRAEEILASIREEIERFRPREFWSDSLQHAKQADRDVLKTILDSAIEEYGALTVAKRLADHASEVNEYVKSILYDSGDSSGSTISKAEQNLVSLSEIIRGRTLDIFESATLTDLIDEAYYDY